MLFLVFQVTVIRQCLSTLQGGSPHWPGLCYSTIPVNFKKALLLGQVFTICQLYIMPMPYKKSCRLPDHCHSTLPGSAIQEEATHKELCLMARPLAFTIDNIYRTLSFNIAWLNCSRNSSELPDHWHSPLMAYTDHCHPTWPC